MKVLHNQLSAVDVISCNAMNGRECRAQNAKLNEKYWMCDPVKLFTGVVKVLQEAKEKFEVMKPKFKTPFRNSIPIPIFLFCRFQIGGNFEFLMNCNFVGLAKPKTTGE